MKCIAVLDSIYIIRNRIKTLASLFDIEVIEAEKPEQLMSIIKARDDIGLIITEIKFANKDGFSIFKEIKDYARQIPIMILTSENRRAYFIKGMQLGASDYVLKPFDGEYLIKRISDLLDSEMPSIPVCGWESFNQEIIPMSIDLNTYIDKELFKASKGKYLVSIMMSIIVDSKSENNTTIDKRYQQIYKSVYSDLNAVIFDTDVFLNYDSRMFIGIFPFCGPENQELIRAKFTSTFKEYKHKNGIEENIQLSNNFTSYPEDGKNREELMTLVNERMLSDVRSMHSLDIDEES